MSWLWECEEQAQQHRAWLLVTLGFCVERHKQADYYFPWTHNQHHLITSTLKRA